jgi:S-sulfosulfanyl-L-cysteine sulfohydrolase
MKPAAPRRNLRSLGAIFAATAITACAAPHANVPVPAAQAPAKAAEVSSRHQVTILFLADLHAQLNTHPELFSRAGVETIEQAGGVARLATAVAGIRRERPGAVLVVDGGDTIQGSGVAALTEGAAIVRGLSPLGIDVGVPGNWEVVYGTKALLQRSRELAYPLVAANVTDAASSAPVFAPYVVREVGGVRVAVVGFTDPDVPKRQPPAYSAGFAYQEANASGLRAAIENARTEGKADVVLLASHIGLSKAVDLAKQLPSVDVHLSGDTHERTYQPIDVGGKWVVEPGAFGSFLGRLDLWVEDGHVVDKSWKLLEVTAKDYPADAAAQKVVDEVSEPFRARLSEIIGETSTPLMRYDVVDTGLDAVLSDALREASGTEIALSNGFRFASPLPAGPVHESDLWDMYPIVTKLKTGRVTGKQLYDFWERELENVFAAEPEKRFGGWVPRPSGMTLRFAADAPAGHRVRELRVGSELVRSNRSYSITACDREGDLPDMVCRIPGARDIRVLDVDAHEAVRRYLKRHRPLAAPTRGRVVAEDRVAPLRTQEAPLAQQTPGGAR